MQSCKNHRKDDCNNQRNKSQSKEINMKLQNDNKNKKYEMNNHEP